MSGEAGLRERPSVDVVVPVFGNLPLVRRCLSSVLSFRTTSVARILVVDDCSAEGEICGYLDGLRGRGAIELIRHEENLGFGAAANTGLTATHRDVVLLNSDTEVHGDWADRLLRCAYARPDVGTVTPFSNHATICSYPFPAWRRALPGGLSLADLDSLFARVNAAHTTDLPTGVGFCLLIRRACLQAVGLFDVNRFGRGYGEESDFCQRALLAGWRNVICADTFVYHHAGGTFGAERPRRARTAERVLTARYPDYARRVDDFILRDQLGPFRRRVDAARALLSMWQRVSLVAERAAERAFMTALAIRAHRRA